MTQKREWTLERVLPYILLVGSILGIVAAFALTYDKIKLIENPTYQPSCNINPIISCGSEMNEPQASLLGVPNTIYGLMGFSALLTLSVVLLAGIKLKKWLWQGIWVGVVAGFGFAAYLFFEGIFRIRAICPFCFLIWISMPPLLWYTTLHMWRQNYLPGPDKLKAWANKHHLDVILFWYVLFFGLLLERFWYYWKTLI